MSVSLIYATVLLAIGTLLVGLIVVGARRRKLPGAKAFCLLLGLVLLWCVVDALRQLSESPQDQIRLDQVGYIAYALLPVGWIVLVYDYRSMLAHRRARIAALCCVPVLTIAFAWTFPAQHLLWVSYATREVHGLIVASGTHGPWFLVHITYSFALTLAGIVMLVRAFFSQGGAPRAQALLFAGGVTVPLVCSGLYVSGLNPLPGFDFTPLGFSLSIAFLLVALLQYQFLDIIPVAFDRIVHHMPSPVIVLDRAGRILAVNPAAQATFRLAPASTGEPLRLVASSAQDGRSVCIDQNSANGLEFIVVQGEARREFILNRVPISTGKGHELGHLFVMYESTAERARQRELEEALRREASLASEAAAASRAKSEFLAVMSHEIRTPLNVIIGSASLLSEEALSPRQQEYAEAIHHSGQSLLTILNDILDVSKIDAGRMTLEQINFDLRSTVGDVVEVFATPAMTRGIQLVFDCEADLDGVYVGDPARLRQVLLNLIGNAVKFTEAGSVTVRVRKAAESESIHFSVTDTGIGIDPSVLPHLFDAFRQADTSTTRRFGGTGLGLAIAQRLVALMGGIITCQSEPGQGSEFSFRVPLRLAERLEVPEPCERCVVLAAPGQAVERLRVVLRLIGYQTVLAADSDAALADPPKLLIFDPNWPELLRQEDIEAFVKKARAVKTLKLAYLVSGPVEPATASSQELIPLQEPWLLRRLRPVLGTPPAVLVEVAEQPSYAGRRLLLAEDNPLNRTVAKHMLCSLGCDIDEATTGIEAVARAQSCHYDLILMDLQMPDADGYEATRRIRRREAAHSLARTPIVAFTAGAFSGERDQAFEAGMDDFLSKPVVKAQLLDVCTRWFDAAPHR
jgi:signal transduction histidine kinase/CheY-like chemotaxis protein